MKKIILGAFIVFTLLATTACRKSHVLQVQHHAYVDANGDTQTKSMTQMAKIILRAGKTHDWVMTKKATGKIVAVKTVKKLFGVVRATIQIDYTQKYYSIKYLDSKNLKYDGTRNAIHPTYNKWIMALQDDIRESLAGYSCTLGAFNHEECKKK